MDVKSQATLLVPIGTGAAILVDGMIVLPTS